MSRQGRPGGRADRHDRPRPKAVVFDFDDTLLATFNSRRQVLIRTASEFGFELSSSKIAAEWGRPFESLIAHLVPEVPFRSFYEAYKRNLMRTAPEVLDGAHGLLSKLRRENIPCYVVTSGDYFLARHDLRAAGLWKYINRLWSSSHSRAHKPDPRVMDGVRTVFRRAGWSPDEIVSVGDSLRDMRVAVANGFVFYAVVTGREKAQDFVRGGLPHAHILKSLREFPV